MICDDKTAVAPGYRHIDTAQAYGVERGVGIFIRDCGVPREGLSVQTGLGAKVQDHHGAKGGPRDRAPRDRNTCSDRQDRPCG
jgi:diketogulonate reductase-like aldo/keto reductase